MPCCRWLGRRLKRQSNLCRQRESRSQPRIAPNCRQGSTVCAPPRQSLRSNPLLPDVLIYQEAVRYALAIQRILQGGRGREGPPAAAARRAARRRTGTRARALDHRDRPGGARLHLENRSQRAALWAGGAAVLFAHRAAPLAAGRLVPWPQRDAERGEFPGGPREAIIGEWAPRDTIVLHLYGRFCNASRFAGEVDFFEALDAVKREYRDRRKPHSGPRLQHGRRFRVGYRHASRRHVRRSSARRRIQRDDRISEAQTHRRCRAALVGAETLPSLRCRRITPSICTTRRRSRTTAKSIRRSRPRTRWRAPWRRRGCG